MADEAVILLTAKRATLLVSSRLVMRPHTVEVGEVHTR